MLEFFYKRRSIRKYTSEPVPEQMITDLLKAAMSAPSGNNRQPWEFIVVREQKMRKALAKSSPYAQMAEFAPLVIVVAGELKEPWMEQDCAAATENLLLAAANMGLGAVWCGLRDEREEKVRALLGIPGTHRAFCLIPVGYPAEEKEPRTQYTKVKVHWEKY